MERTLVSESVKKVDQEVLLKGWINSRRDHGRIVFFDLKDRSGVIQAVWDQKADFGPEDVVQVSGKIALRPKGMVNDKIPTGTVELQVKDLKVISKAKTLPIPIDNDGYDIDEEIRLKYRFLDLRRKRLTNNIRLRSKFVNLCRQYLFENDFAEIETPLLTKSTPEGSRDFVVPSRLNPGKFYALPQSPQQYKQLLMVAGFERYFQIARCLRDEDLRSDRGFEHTQIDMEMSFVRREDVMSLTESMFTSVFEKLGATIFKKPFPVISYKEALEKYKSDKFDIRSQDQKKPGVMGFAWVTDFPFFEKDKDGKWTYTHNPFSEPLPEDKEKFLKGEVESIRTTQYDLICNGYEVGGGSVRSTDPRVLAKVFETIGHDMKDIKKQFGHMLEAFEYGVPPHGGIAPGIDRLMMVLTGETAMKEVVAFPTTSKGITSIMDAPAEISPTQLKELHLKIVE